MKGDGLERQASEITVTLQSAVRTLDFLLHTMGIHWEEHGEKQGKEIASI